MQRVAVEGYTVAVDDGLPATYAALCQNAALVDEIDVRSSDGHLFFVAITQDGDHWPRIISAQRHSPDQRSGFFPGVLIVPGTERAFIGAGERLLCYDLQSNCRLWEDHADTGFWGWQQVGSFVLMAAELEFAVWTTSGDKLWTTFVEPPWTFEVQDNQVVLDVMGATTVRRLSDGAIS